MNKQLNTTISLKDNEINLLKTTDNNNKVENAIQLIENTKIDDNLEKDWEEIEDVIEFKKKNPLQIAKRREIEKLKESRIVIMN